MHTDGSTDEKQISRGFSFDYGAHRLGSDPTSQKRDVVHPPPVNTGILRCAQNDKWGMDWGMRGTRRKQIPPLRYGMTDKRTGNGKGEIRRF
jgi:hypothetical protein